MSLKCYGKHVLIRKIPPKEKNGSLWIPDPYIKKQNQGFVAQIGEEVEYVRRGSYVLFEDLGGTDINDPDGREYKLLHEDQIDTEIILEPTIIEGIFHLDSNLSPIPATLDSIFDTITAHFAEMERNVVDGVRKVK